MAGPIVIFGPKVWILSINGTRRGHSLTTKQNANYDEDLGPVMVSDWYHEYYQTVIDALLEPLPAVNIPMSDNNLVRIKLEMWKRKAKLIFVVSVDQWQELIRLRGHEFAVHTKRASCQLQLHKRKDLSHSFHQSICCRHPKDHH